MKTLINKNFKAYLFITLACFTFLLLINRHEAYAEYDGGSLISDSVFLDSNSMSRQDIQNFLEDRGAGISSMSFVLNCYGPNSTERAWYTAAGANCDQETTAADLIYFASQIYGVNPQVTLATLQKEQSLATAPNPTSYQLDHAMGYGCPTTGGCEASNFAYQIDSGVWVLRYHYERANGNFSWWSPSTSWTCGTEKAFYKPNLYPSQNVDFYDEDAVFYRTHYIENAATSSFYCYTPHAYNNPEGLYGREPFGTTGRYYSGSYNFVLFFELWFGDTSGTPMFKVAGDNKTYILGSEDNYYHVQSQELLKAYGYEKRFYIIDSKPSNYLEGKTFSGVLPLHASFGSSEVYLVDRGGKYLFSSTSLKENEYGYALNTEAKLNSSVAGYLPTAGNMRSVIREYGGSEIYVMENGKRRRVPDLDAYRTGSPPYSTLDYVRLSSDYMESLTPGYPLLGPNKVIRLYDTGSFKFWDGTNIFNISRDTANLVGLEIDYEMGSGEIENLPRQPEPVLIHVKDSNYYYILDNNTKRIVNHSDLTNFGYDADDFLLVPDELLENIETSTATPLITIGGRGSKYLIQGKEIVHFTSREAILELGYTYDDITDISEVTHTEIPFKGNYVIETGTLFKVTGQPQTFIITGLTSKLYIDSNTIINEFGFIKDSTKSFEANLVSNYTNESTLNYIVRNTAGTVFLVNLGGAAYEIPTAQLASSRFDITPSSLPALSNSIFSNFEMQGTLKEVLQDSSSGLRYYVENAERRLITSDSALAGIGFGTSDITVVSTNFLATLPRGADIN